jgi:hypothetical protein
MENLFPVHFLGQENSAGSIRLPVSGTIDNHGIPRYIIGLIVEITIINQTV